METTHHHDKTKDNTLKILCSSCKNTTKHKVLTSINEEGFEEWNEYHTFQWNTDFEIIQCLGCDTVSFRSHSINSEYSNDEGDPISMELLYPKRSKDTLAIKHHMNVPYNLQSIFNETIVCYNNENLILCGAGVRALVEGICKENGITGGNVEITKSDGSKQTVRKTNLQGKINGLYESGKLTKPNAEILHEHRFLGNGAVHELTNPSKEDLHLAIEIVENVFDNLYEIPRKGQRLKRKRLGR